MSQHVFRTTLDDGRSVEVLSGWDRPLQGFFLVIEWLNAPKDTEEPYLFSNLNMEESHPKAYDYFRKVLAEFGIIVPQQMIEEILRDGEENKGNKRVIHDVRDGNYVRVLQYEE